MNQIKENVVVIGIGEIGNSIMGVLQDSEAFNIYKKDIEPLHLPNDITVDIMHVCIPFSDTFVDIVSNYINEFNPRLVIINSTVRPGTTDELFKRTKISIVHSPVRGRHPDLKGGLLKFVKFIGPVNEESGKRAKEHFDKLGIKSEILSNAVNSELGKLLSTTYYAVNIAFHQEMDHICERYGADFKEAITRFNQTCVMDIEHKVPRPVMFPGVIEGHCLMPNIGILKKDIDSDFLKAIEISNERTKERLKQGKIKYKSMDDLFK